VATAYLFKTVEASVAFELVLRPSAHASSEAQDKALPLGCEEVWEHAVLRNDNGDAGKNAIKASQDSISWRGAALSLKAPSQVHALLEAIGEAREGGPSYVAFATVAERTRSLSPRAKKLAYAGNGPDSAFVIGWPSLDQLRFAFCKHRGKGTRTDTSGSVISEALLAKLPLDDPLRGELQDMLDCSSTGGNSTIHGVLEAAATFAMTPLSRLRVSWHRPFLD